MTTWLDSPLQGLVRQATHRPRQLMTRALLRGFPSHLIFRNLQKSAFASQLLGGKASDPCLMFVVFLEGRRWTKWGPNGRPYRRHNFEPRMRGLGQRSWKIVMLFKTSHGTGGVAFGVPLDGRPTGQMELRDPHSC